VSDILAGTLAPCRQSSRIEQTPTNYLLRSGAIMSFHALLSNAFKFFNPSSSSPSVHLSSLSSPSRPHFIEFISITTTTTTTKHSPPTVHSPTLFSTNIHEADINTSSMLSLSSSSPSTPLPLSLSLPSHSTSYLPSIPHPINFTSPERKPASSVYSSVHCNTIRVFSYLRMTGSSQVDGDGLMLDAI
jgi:hypothetical protein